MSVTRRSLLQSAAAAAFSPAFLTAARASDGFIELTAGPAKAQLLAEGEPKTDVWAYGDTVPGPILRAKQGEPFRLRFINNLPQPSTIHWHGIRIENAMDGVAGLTQEPVLPGESFDYVFTPPDAGTYWYHPHSRTWEQMARGLYGALIVEEREAPGFDLDLPLIVDDWRLTKSGAFHEESLGSMMEFSHAGRLGNWVTVNGTSLPSFDLPAGGIARLRLINTANSRVLNLKLDDFKGEIIAFDGQPITPQAIPSDVLPFAPAQRIDLAVRVPETVSGKLELKAQSREVEITIAEFKITGESRPVKQIPALPENPLPVKLDLSSPLQSELRMEGGAMGGLEQARLNGELLSIRQMVRKNKAWAFNGVVGRTDEPLFSAKRGQTVVIDIINDTAWPHAMHFHGHHVKVIERNGQPVEGAPWRDTELMQRDDRIKVAMPADNPGKWMLHCHMLEHQAAGMATWFEVT